MEPTSTDRLNLVDFYLILFQGCDGIEKELVMKWPEMTKEIDFKIDIRIIYACIGN